VEWLVGLDGSVVRYSPRGKRLIYQPGLLLVDSRAL